MNVAIVYGDYSFVASVYTVWSSGTSKKHDMFGTNSFRGVVRHFDMCKTRAKLLILLMVVYTVIKVVELIS